MSDNIQNDDAGQMGSSTESHHNSTNQRTSLATSSNTDAVNKRIREYLEKGAKAVHKVAIEKTKVEKILNYIIDSSIFRTLGRIRLERLIDSGSGSGASQILLELQMTEELLERINFCNGKAKSFQYRLEMEIPDESEPEMVVA